MPAPLKNHQKWEIVKLARAAFAKIDPADVDGQTFDEWRHSEVARACGKAGLRCCDQDDYAPVKAHFLDLTGASGAAFNWHVHGAGNPKRVAMAKLMEQLNDGGKKRGYAEFICQKMWKCNLEDASTAQVWKVFYTVRNRVLAGKRAQKGNGDFSQTKNEKETAWLN